ncbi:MAG: protein kinase [Pirellulaceae bacterium]|nr:protein kinase [Pirellulaceae bacterium]
MRSRVQQAAAEYVEAWRGHRQGIDEILLATFLPASEDPLRIPVLLELLPIDLEQRRRRGEKTLLEHYLATFPELGQAQDLPVELIAAEYRIRRLQGDPLRIEGYRHRFPTQFDALVELVGGIKGKPSPTPRGYPSASDAPSPAAPFTPFSAASPSSSPVPLWAQGTMSPGDPAEATIARKVMPGGDGYQLHECIGRGMFGEVWRAEAPGGVEVAVKIIHRTAGDQLTQVELRALELMKRLRHPFLLQVQAYWLSGDQLHIVMDLADKTLMDRLEECRRDRLPGIPAEELLTYMREAAEALDFLHSNQVLHRDVKPANILLAKGHARLADFGLARLFMKGGADVVATMIGTPLYMGPEVWEQKVGPESDQYSLAATYVELRLGRPLFDVESQEEVKESHLTAAPDLKGLPPAEKKVIERALAKKRKERYASCKQFAQSLEDAILGPSNKQKSLLTRRQTVVALGVGAVTIAAAFETLRRLGLLRFQGLEVTGPSGIEILAGEEQTFEVHVLGARDPSAAKPEFSGLPEGVSFQTDEAPRPASEVGAASEAAAGAEIWRVKVNAELNLPRASYGLKRDIILTVVDGKQTAERVIPLKVEPPVMTIPPECEPASGARRKRIAEEGRNYWERIVRKIPGDAAVPSGTSCELILIPYNSELKLPSFYMMTNKVWNELFAVFDKHYVSTHPRPKPAKVDEADLINDAEEWPDAWWELGAAKGAEQLPGKDHPMRPVMAATFHQAEEFAKWLGGALPTCQQWDTAAGLYLPSAAKKQGPFQGVWKDGPGPKLAIAVGGGNQGTVPITEVGADLSPLGCRHMAGNGSEWTRDATKGSFGQVTLRGCQYRQKKPLFYSDLRDEDKREIEDMTAPNPYIGFRIVIELKSPAQSPTPKP